ncbi:MAG: MBL fold metallo-hydrolase [Desulfobacteraceae bacterium]
MSETTITVVCENRTAAPVGVAGEYGFAAFIEKDGKKILFDTGQGIALKNNAAVLKTDLAKVDQVVLSHGHFDHTGGLSQALMSSWGSEVIAHPDIFDDKYTEMHFGKETGRFYIGVPYRREFLESALGATFSMQKGYIEISPGVWFSGEVPRRTDFERPDSALKVKRDGEFLDDPMLDDASILVETDSGPVIVAGCAHAGIVNVMNHFREKSGHESFHAVIGGTHLGFAEDEQQLFKTMDAFEKMGLDLIAVSHCTGNEAAAACYNRFREKFAFANAGWRMTF